MSSARPARARVCGACHACCVLPALDLPALKKPAGDRCRHLDGRGLCTIYARRPDVCRGFECAWLAGSLPAGLEYRPERLGLMLAGEEYEGITVIKAYEVWKGASMSSPRANELLHWLGERELVLIVDNPPPDPSTTVIGPPAKHRRLEAALGDQFWQRLLY
jgi:hypothetical protein